MKSEKLKFVGREVAELLESISFDKVGSIYGYALAMERNIELAIEEGFEAAMLECVSSINNSNARVKVIDFAPNKESLKSLIACDFPLENFSGVIVECAAA